jgi:alkanesulfonate monooxygenase SsuD/methylene tetrahydromethanopterin reductase-like flavin-dependent oxidoreductase (luciferase family)
VTETATPPVKLGALLWPQTDSWASIRDAAIRAEQAGAASLWTWDHLMAIVGPWEAPILEGWSVLSGWATVTERATLGLMVAANTFRNPGLTAKLATTLDHISGGRAVLGIGGAWFEREHEGYGIDFGSGFGERLDRMDESVMLLRRLLDGERLSHDGPVYRMQDALCEPRPVQAHLPILIGGSGPQKTLRTLARYGDGWNTGGTLEKVRERDAILRERCAEVGRDHTTIERTMNVDMVIRDDREAALAAYKAQLARYGDEYDPEWPIYIGTPAEIAAGLAPFVELGFRHFILDLAAPYDLETIDRMGEVLALLNP